MEDRYIYIYIDRQVKNGKTTKKNPQKFKSPRSHKARLESMKIINAKKRYSCRIAWHPYKNKETHGRKKKFVKHIHSCSRAKSRRSQKPEEAKSQKPEARRSQKPEAKCQKWEAKSQKPKPAKKMQKNKCQKNTPAKKKKQHIHKCRCMNVYNW